MKKEIIIIFIILTFIICLNYITEKYTNESVEVLNQKLNELNNEMLKDEFDNELIDSKMNELFYIWDEKESILAYYIEHDELEKVESKINLIKGNIEVKNNEDAISDIEDAIFILNHILEKYKFNFKNLF